MAKKALKVQELQSYISGQEIEDSTAKKRKEDIEGFVDSFRGKTFAELTGSEKDDLLKAVAIKTRMIAE